MKKRCSWIIQPKAHAFWKDFTTVNILKIFESFLRRWSLDRSITYTPFTHHLTVQPPITFLRADNWDSQIYLQIFVDLPPLRHCKNLTSLVWLSNGNPWSQNHVAATAGPPSHSWGGEPFVNMQTSTCGSGMPMSGILRRGWRAKIQVHVGKCGPKIVKLDFHPGIPTWFHQSWILFHPQLQALVLIESLEKKKWALEVSCANLWVSS